MILRSCWGQSKTDVKNDVSRNGLRSQNKSWLCSNISSLHSTGLTVVIFLPTIYWKFTTCQASASLCSSRSQLILTTHMLGTHVTQGCLVLLPYSIPICHMIAWTIIIKSLHVDFLHCLNPIDFLNLDTLNKACNLRGSGKLLFHWRQWVA